MRGPTIIAIVPHLAADLGTGPASGGAVELQAVVSVEVVDIVNVFARGGVVNELIEGKPRQQQCNLVHQQLAPVGSRLVGIGIWSAFVGPAAGWVHALLHRDDPPPLRLRRMTWRCPRASA
jgi:hypothetical protein